MEHPCIKYTWRYWKILNLFIFMIWIIVTSTVPCSLSQEIIVEETKTMIDIFWIWNRTRWNFILFFAEYATWKDFRILSTDSQKKQFQDFLLRANKYPTLSISGKGSSSSVAGKKIVLVEVRIDLEIISRRMAFFPLFFVLFIISLTAKMFDISVVVSIISFRVLL